MIPIQALNEFWLMCCENFDQMGCPDQSERYRELIKKKIQCRVNEEYGQDFPPRGEFSYTCARCWLDNLSIAVKQFFKEKNLTGFSWIDSKDQMKQNLVQKVPAYGFKLLPSNMSLESWLYNFEKILRR